ncbi:hypothetical protein HOE31_00420 [bacterium]|jgi:hypothetical protein|nr:hypothetical protein [bacterium]MBT4121405.1 hypothetical protein [bacterium]MBT4495296.1 hypothetical protein [bacterium]MBT4763673.1 hypothetical protein [bacterium]MBT5401044.1 hypothetical protein [bacterium]
MNHNNMILGVGITFIIILMLLHGSNNPQINWACPSIVIIICVMLGSNWIYVRNDKNNHSVEMDKKTEEINKLKREMSNYKDILDNRLTLLEKRAKLIRPAREFWRGDMSKYLPCEPNQITDAICGEIKSTKEINKKVITICNTDYYRVYLKSDQIEGSYFIKAGDPVLKVEAKGQIYYLLPEYGTVVQTPHHNSALPDGTEFKSWGSFKQIYE